MYNDCQARYSSCVSVFFIFKFQNTTNDTSMSSVRVAAKYLTPSSIHDTMKVDESVVGRFVVHPFGDLKPTIKTDSALQGNRI